MRKAGFNWLVTPFKFVDQFGPTSGFVLLLPFCSLQHVVSGLSSAVQHSIFDQTQKIFGNIFIDRESTSVDDCHVHSLFDGVVQECAVHGLSKVVQAPERKGKIRKSPRDLCVRQSLLNDTSRIDEINRVIIVLIHTSADCQDVGVKDDIPSRKVNDFSQNFVGTCADADFLGFCCSLAFFVKCHNHNSCPISFDEFCLPDEFLFTALQTDGIDYAFALKTTQTCFDDVKFGGVDHQRNFADPGFRRNKIDEFGHGNLPI
mmetsp:Transcript_20166/g.28350  ORF Transcript_20166/g.28350 Transcript_20166/m.28350 type:complete len:260 (+) Transcript_20166:374-1153(+)